MMNENPRRCASRKRGIQAAPWNRTGAPVPEEVFSAGDLERIRAQPLRGRWGRGEFARCLAWATQVPGSRF